MANIEELKLTHDEHLLLSSLLAGALAGDIATMLEASAISASLIEQLGKEGVAQLVDKMTAHHKFLHPTDPTVAEHHVN